MKWFGESWGAPACDPADHTTTPTGRECASCERPIADNDQGLVLPELHLSGTVERAWHLDCFLQSVGIRRVWKARGICDAYLGPAQPVLVPGERRVHILLHGATLCGLLGPASDWPVGHVWTYLRDKDTANCELCKRRAPAYEQT